MTLNGFIPVTCAAAAALLLFRCPVAAGQAATNPTTQAVAGPTTDASSGVLVHESAVAETSISAARKMEERKDWEAAAGVYQGLLNAFSEGLVPVSPDKGGFVRYTSVARSVRERLCHWPREGLDAYCRIYEPKAAALLDAVRKASAEGHDDTPNLQEAVRLYFVTDSGKAAALRLIDEDLKGGASYEAAWLGDELLDLHPNLAAERPAVLSQTALAYRQAGDAKATARDSWLMPGSGQA